MVSAQSEHTQRHRLALSNATVSFIFIASLILIILLGGQRRAGAQGAVTVLETGGGQPLVSDQVVLQASGLLSPMVQYEFGFETDEVPSPDTLLDSFTVSMEDAANNLAVLSTTDATGTEWEPPSPGAVVLAPSAIQYQSVTPTQMSPINGNGVAYLVDFAVPSQFTGSDFTLDFDLFDNLDPTTSAAGWFSNVQLVSVPEPSPLILASISAAIYAVKRKLKR